MSYPASALPGSPLGRPRRGSGSRATDGGAPRRRTRSRHAGPDRLLSERSQLIDEAIRSLSLYDTTSIRSPRSGCRESASPLHLVPGVPVAACEDPTRTGSTLRCAAPTSQYPSQEREERVPISLSWIALGLAALHSYSRRQRRVRPGSDNGILSIDEMTNGPRPR